MYDYSGRTVLVTGASKGIGRALAADAARRGANLVVTARSGGLLDELSRELHSEYGTRTNVIPSGLAGQEDAAHIHHQVRDAGIRVDILANVAGLGRFGPFIEQPIEDSVETIDVDISGLVALTHAFGRDLIEQGSGGIINVGSLSGNQPVPYQAVYAASKAFVLSFSHALRHELAGSGVNVMVVAPGNTRTSFADDPRAAGTRSHADSAERVARDILDAFGRGRAECVPGRFLNRLTSAGAGLLPRGAVTRLAALWAHSDGLDRGAGR